MMLGKRSLAAAVALLAAALMITNPAWAAPHPAPSDASGPIWNEGPTQSYLDHNCVTGVVGPLADVWAGWYGQPGVTPKVGQVYFVRVLMGAISNPCVGTLGFPELYLPPDTVPAVSPANPVLCAYKRPTDTGFVQDIPDCPAQPTLEPDGGYTAPSSINQAGGGYPLDAGVQWIVDFPVVSSTAGAFWLNSSTPMIDGSTDPTFVSNVPIEVMPVDVTPPPVSPPPVSPPPVSPPPVSPPPVSPPTAPRPVRLTGGVRAVTVQFHPPTSDGGSGISSYQYSLDHGRSWHPLPTVGASTRTATVRGLRNGTRYGLNLRAVNGAGVGTASPAISSSTLAAPGAVRTLHIRRITTTTVQLTFRAPLHNGGSRITGYRYSLDNGRTWRIATTTASGGQRLLSISRLHRHQRYTVRVEAVTAVGDGSSSAPVRLTTR